MGKQENADLKVGATRPAEAGGAMLSGKLSGPSFRPGGHTRFARRSSLRTRCKEMAGEESRELPHQSGGMSRVRLFEWGTLCPGGTRTSGIRGPRVHSSSHG